MKVLPLEKQRAANSDDFAVPSKVTCPHCWQIFDLSEFLAVAEHNRLVGDNVLGPDAQRRFLPSRFTPDGKPKDSYGTPCSDLACPRCHLVVPRDLATIPSFFASIIGGQSSGKSYLLTSMVSQLRDVMSSKFAFAFLDVDTRSNGVLNEYEKILFGSAMPQEFTTLPKTQMTGHTYNSAVINGVETRFPQPFMFSIAPQENHVWYKKKGRKLSRVLVLYDNAGENFDPYADNLATPGTQHLAHSHGLFFLFDPTRDARFRQKIKSTDPQVKAGLEVESQDTVLITALERIRRYSSASRREALDRPLTVVVTKFDIWRSLLTADRQLPLPWKRGKGPEGSSVLDLDAIQSVSASLRSILMEVCPRLVATAEAFSSTVTYVPTSATGHSPRVQVHSEVEDAPRDILVVRPSDIKPIWATVPMLHMLALFGMIPGAKRRRAKGLKEAEEVKVSGRIASLRVPGTDARLTVPVSYLGSVMMCPLTGTRFWIPQADESKAGD